MVISGKDNHYYSLGKGLLLVCAEEDGDAEDWGEHGADKDKVYLVHHLAS
jgi:hypothetical protein